MKAVIINTFEKDGGAARAANRLHNALKVNAVDSSMVVMYKTSADKSVHTIDSVPDSDSVDYQYILRRLIPNHYIDSSRTALSNTLFSFAYPGYDIASHPVIHAADIINLHWVAFYQSPVTLAKLMRLGKPVVWTLHDMCPFTGGCHYSAGCEGYLDECMNCPQLSEDPYSLPNAVLNDKLELFAGAPLTIVTPSRWLADCARKSALFRHCRVEVIPNSIETDMYNAAPKSDAKKELGIDPRKVVLMFGADSSNEKRKGFTELESALARAKSDPLFQDTLYGKGITILSLGPLTADMSNLGLDVKALGHVSDDSLISRAYSAADIFILPSLEDNLPNMMLEAMACGTPVLAFSTGGIPDVVAEGVNGSLVSTGDTRALAERLVELVTDKALRERLGAEASLNAQDWFAQKVQAERYISLFEDLCVNNYDATEWEKGTGSAKAVLDIGCGSHFECIRHKVMLDSLLRAMSDICEQKRLASQGGLITHAKSLEDALSDRDATIDALQKRLERLEQLESSLSWRLTAPLRKILDALRQ